MDDIKYIEKYKKQVTKDINKLDSNLIDEIADLIATKIAVGNSFFIAGNGGSNATAIHFREDIMSLRNIFKVKAYSLSETPTITAIANDFDYSEIFKMQLENLMDQGDVFIGISCSGKSPNIVKAMEYARRKGETIAITGFDGGEIAKIANNVIHIKNKSFEQLEDIHLVICHILALCVREKLR